MKITARALNRTTLDRQLLLERARTDVAEGTRRVVALQAQHPASPYLALWNRLEDFDPAALDAAFADRTVAKATLMRITLHAVHAADYPVLRAAMEPTLYASRLGYRFAAAGLTPEDAGGLVPRLLAYAERPRGSAEVQSWVAEQVGAERADGAWWGLKGYAPLHHAPTGGPWSFGHRPAFVASGTAPVPAGRTGDPEALRALLLRYLSGFGPASAADAARFAMLARGPVRAAFGDLLREGAVEPLTGPDRTELFDLAGAERHDGGAPAPARLMAMWDSVLLAYEDRTRVLPEAYRRAVIRNNGDTLPTLLVDGAVAGVWRPVEGGIEATAFHRLPAAAWEELAAEAVALTGLLAGREEQVYRRYGHWWPKLPADPAVRGEVRLLPGTG
ncbi:winged helix DNA-binding domain-containing protein [Streptomyces sp. NPDC097619]|uniref:winged helix DNA-binding domain-containing protein n=1 Tax=Streptomyces sp. NPDC097619 TaxID=3157228 RepID=UPI00332B86B5